MKKLTAGILASLIGLVSANSAEAAVASTSYVDAGLETKQQKLTSDNFKATGEGKFISGVTVDATGNVTFETSSPEAITYDSVLSNESENGVQNKVIKAALDLKQDTLKEANAGAGIKIANGVITADVTTDVLNTGLAEKQNKLTVDNQGDNVQLSFDAQGNLLKISATDTTYSEATADVAGLTKLYGETGAATNGTMTQAAITTALGNKQNTLTQAANAGEGITISTDGKIAADITQTEFDTALGNKQNTLTQAANAGEGITISADGKISADITNAEFETKQNKLTAGKFINIDQATGEITTTYSAGTGIKIDDVTGAISADNQLNKVTATGDDGLQVLTRKNCDAQGVCEYVWETIDRVYGD